MAICPAGHTSKADDYCDLCGLPVTQGSDAVPAAPVREAPGALCPHCGTNNAPDALFCEACGYDFTTGTMPRSATPSADVPPAQWSNPAIPEGDADRWSSVSRPDGLSSRADESDLTRSSLSRPDEPAEASPDGEPDPRRSSSSNPDESADASPDDLTPAPSPDELPAAASPAEPSPPPASPEPAVSEPAASAPAPTPPSRRPLQARPTSVEWVAEIWIDPDWYATQGATDALPSPGLPEVVPLRASSALIGRTSLSRNIHPDALRGEIHAPHLLDVEVLSALRGLTLGGHLDAQTAEQALRDYFDFTIARRESEPLADRIWQLRHQFTSYDASYLALAEALSAPLHTCCPKLVDCGTTP